MQSHRYSLAVNKEKFSKEHSEVIMPMNTSRKLRRTNSFDKE